MGDHHGISPGHQKDGRYQAVEWLCGTGRQKPPDHSAVPYIFTNLGSHPLT